MLTLDEAKRFRLVTCGEGKRIGLRYCGNLPFHGELKYELICRCLLESHLAYNRVALTDYFQHRSVEKLYLNQGGVSGSTFMLSCAFAYGGCFYIFYFQ
jgi:nitrite reductase (NAD(P)H)